MRGIVAHDHSAKLIAARRLPQPLFIRVPFYEEDQDGPKKDGSGKEYTLTIKFIQELETQSLIRSVKLFRRRYPADTRAVTFRGSLIIAGMIFSPLWQL
jgi:hypothetical protein